MNTTKLPLVCVVMPVYNGVKTIEFAIKSLLYQTYTNWNCVIVNDGSTDATKDILDKITDNRFEIIHLEKNKGRGYARQVCLENASGEFLTYLDADDFYHQDKLKCQVEIFQTYSNLSLVACGQGSFDNAFILRSIRGMRFSGTHAFQDASKIKFVPVTSMIWLERAQKSKYNSNLNASEDVDFFADYLNGNIYFISNHLHYYYYEFESISYFKTIEYSFNSLKRIVFSRRNMKTSLFLKELLIISFKLVFYVFFYHLLGKNYFINKRGIKPTDEHIAEFESVVNNLQKALNEKNSLRC